jgi:GWxTD domain-containing protein
LFERSALDSRWVAGAILHRWRSTGTSIGAALASTRPLCRTSSTLILLAFMLLAGCAGAGRGGGYGGNRQPWFDADVLTGLGDGGRPRATVTVSIPFRRMVFFREDGGFVSRYRLRAFQRADDHVLSVQEWTGEIRVEEYADTRQPKVLRRTVGVDLIEVVSKVDRHDLELQVEILGTHLLSRRKVEVRPRHFESGGLALGELALYRLRDRSGGPDTEYEVLGNGMPDPNLFRQHAIGGFDLATGPPWLLMRVFDLRAAPPESEYAITIQALDPESGGDRYSRTLMIPRQGHETSVFMQIPIDALAFGKNQLRVTLPGAEGIEIEVSNLGLDLGDAESWSANLRQIEILAAGEEMRSLREAPASQRRESWESFWSRRDPDPSTPENERLDLHYHRVAHARSHLRDGFRDGALSDRGRIWILYGEPDSIESASPGFESSSAYEVWTYRERGLVYYFRDTDGFGSFRLVWREVV